LALSSGIVVLFMQSEYKIDRLISANEEISKPRSFMIDGPDPFEMGQKEWDTVQAHYLNFYYR
jgi:hypothetical protein